MSLPVWLGLGLLGGLGAVARFLVEVWLTPRTGTLAVNLAGSLAIGLLAGTGADAFALLAVGFLGAFTTFSAWMLHARDRVVLDLGGTLLLGLLAVWLGDRLA